MAVNEDGVMASGGAYNFLFSFQIIWVCEFNGVFCTCYLPANM